MLLSGFCLYLCSFVSSIHLKKLRVCFPVCLSGHELNKFRATLAPHLCVQSCQQNSLQHSEMPEREEGQGGMESSNMMFV